MHTWRLSPKVYTYMFGSVSVVYILVAGWEGLWMRFTGGAHPLFKWDVSRCREAVVLGCSFMTMEHWRNVYVSARYSYSFPARTQNAIAGRIGMEWSGVEQCGVEWNRKLWIQGSG